MATRFGRSFRGSTLSECTWITYNLFQKLNQGLYEKFHALNSLRSSFSKLGRVDGDKWQPPLKVYHKCKGSKAQALIWHSLDDKEPSWNLYIMG